MATPDRGERAIIEAQHHCRELQLRALVVNVEKLLDEQIYQQPENFAALTFVSWTPPVILHATKSPAEQDELYSKAARAARSIIEITKITGILLTLLATAEKRSREMVVVDIDQTRYEFPSLKSVFNCKPELLEEVTKEGLAQAWIQLLKILQGETPLGRPPYDLVISKNRTFFDSGGGGKFFTLPTKIPRVDLCCHYALGKQIPDLSLMVKPFER